jgi:outer membrane receptor protein involved in Fe transport
MNAKGRWIKASTLLLILVLACPLWSGTTGKIAGTIIDKKTSEPLPGVLVMVQGTTLGTAADSKGNYTVLEVPPGSYTVYISMIGYAKTAVSDVRVLIDQTAHVNVDLEVEALKGETVTIVAKKEIVKQDVATSVVAVSSQEIQELPVSNVQNIVGLQAGIQGNFMIRGSASNEALLMMDGAVLRDPRNNAPLSSPALSSIKEISIERGGFTAEYGQVQSGIINVVTQEGSKSDFSGSVEFKYSPPAPKYFDLSPFDRNSYYYRPYLDDAVCWTGTQNGNWNEYTQRQYPSFEGWNAISRRLMSDNDPSNDLSPKAAQRLFMWDYRRGEPNKQPDYNIDAGFGGPIPVIGKSLGNLRFYTSYRRNRNMLLVPLTRDDYVDFDWNLKLTADLARNMKLMVTALTGKQYTIAENWSWNYIQTPDQVATNLDRPGNYLGNANYSLADIGYQNIGLKLTHTLSSKAYYEVSLEHLSRDYFTRPPAARNLTKKYEIVPGYFVDEAPFGYNPTNLTGLTGIMYGGHTCKTRDRSDMAATTLKADFTSQLNFSNLFKAGIQFIYNDLNFDFGRLTSLSDGKTYDEHVMMHKFPVSAVAYAQDKLETKGFIMNIGLRMDYSDTRTDWWNVEPYSKYFYGTQYDPSKTYPMNAAKPQWQLSPRLGISHPVTENSKLFFNYGHYKQQPMYEGLYRIGRSDSKSMVTFGDPNMTLAKTVAYELGYDHSLFGDYLLQLSAFYKDITDQQDSTTYQSMSGVFYTRTTTNNYSDIRGFELTLRKNRGRWWTFFANYTYQVTSQGHFGRKIFYEDPSQQQVYDDATVHLYQQRPIPTPYARFNFSVYSPDQYGPSFGGLYPLGGYMANILLDWQSGPWETFNPLNVSSVQNNVQEADFFNSTLRLNKTFVLNRAKIQFFADITNLFNYRRMTMNAWGASSGDRINYFNSLHLPKSKAYDNIPGNDRVGTYRKPGADFQPIEQRTSIDPLKDTGDPGVIYYEKTAGKYVEFGTGGWADVDKNRMDRILKDKAYIDMPDRSSFAFLNPRDVFFGIRISFDLGHTGR